MKKIKIKNKAFTLIELLVVITIIGILSGIVIVSVQDGIGRARIAGSQRFSHSIRTRLALDMVGRWPFENNTVDHSGWNNHGTIHGNPAFVSGVVGQALRFDGDNDFVETTRFNPSVFTLEAWVNPVVVAAQKIITNHVNGVTWESIDLGTSVFIFNIANSGVDRRTLSFPTISSGVWTHIVATYNGSQMKVYHNGVLIAGPFAATGVPWDSPARFSIGAMASTLSPPAVEEFNGVIDEVRIFRAAVPTSYIQKRYVEGVKSLASSGGITPEEKQQKIVELRNSGQLVIDLDAALVGPIDFSPYAHYFEVLSLEATE